MLGWISEHLFSGYNNLNFGKWLKFKIYILITLFLIIDQYKFQLYKIYDYVGIKLKRKYSSLDAIYPKSAKYSWHIPGPPIAALEFVGRLDPGLTAT